MYVIKAGSLYLKADGGHSPHQAEALRVAMKVNAPIRYVRLRERACQHTGPFDNTGVPASDTL